MKNKFNSIRARLLGIALAGWFLPAQSQNWNWAKGYGEANHLDYASGICTDPSGNVYVTGTFMSPTMTIGSYTLTNVTSAPTSGPEIFLAKFDPSGNVLWAKNYGGNATAWGLDVKCDANGNVFLLALVGSDTVDFGNGISLMKNTGSNTACLVKINSSGVTQWKRAATPETSCTPQCMAIDADGDVYMAGILGALTNSFEGTTDTLEHDNSSMANSFLIKYDNAGNAKFLRRIYGCRFRQISSDGPRSMAVSAAKNIYITGATTDPNDQNFVSEIFVTKYNSTGNISWVKFYGHEDDNVNGIALDAQENVFICGEFEQNITFGSSTLTNSYNGTEYNRFATKLDKDGNVQWAKKLSAGSDAFCNSIAVDPNGSIYVGGQGFDSTLFGSPMTKWEAWITKLNSNGAADYTLYSSDGTLTGSISNINAVAVSSNGKVYVAGSYLNSTNLGSIYLAAQGTGDILVAHVSNSGSGNAISRPGNSQVLVHPNPAGDILYLNTPEAGCNYTFCDITGKNCLSGTLNNNAPIVVTQLAKGMYHLQVMKGDELIYSGKISKH